MGNSSWVKGGDAWASGGTKSKSRRAHVRTLSEESLDMVYHSSPDQVLVDRTQTAHKENNRSLKKTEKKERAIDRNGSFTASSTHRGATPAPAGLQPVIYNNTGPTCGVPAATAQIPILQPRDAPYISNSNFSNTTTTNSDLQPQVSAATHCLVNPVDEPTRTFLVPVSAMMEYNYNHVMDATGEHYQPQMPDTTLGPIMHQFVPGPNSGVNSHLSHPDPSAMAPAGTTFVTQMPPPMHMVQQPQHMVQQPQLMVQQPQHMIHQQQPQPMTYQQQPQQTMLQQQPQHINYQQQLVGGYQPVASAVSMQTTMGYFGEDGNIAPREVMLVPGGINHGIATVPMQPISVVRGQPMPGQPMQYSAGGMPAGPPVILNTSYGQGQMPGPYPVQHQVQYGGGAPVHHGGMMSAHQGGMMPAPQGQYETTMNQELNGAKDFAPTGDKPSTMYYVRQFDNQYVSMSRATIDSFGKAVRWYAEPSGRMYAVRLVDMHDDDDQDSDSS